MLSMEEINKKVNEILKGLADLPEFTSFMANEHILKTIRKELQVAISLDYQGIDNIDFNLVKRDGFILGDGKGNYIRIGMHDDFRGNALSINKVDKMDPFHPSVRDKMEDIYKHPAPPFKQETYFYPNDDGSFDVEKVTSSLSEKVRVSFTEQKETINEIGRTYYQQALYNYTKVDSNGSVLDGFDFKEIIPIKITPGNNDVSFISASSEEEFKKKINGLSSYENFIKIPATILDDYLFANRGKLSEAIDEWKKKYNDAEKNK